MTDNFNPNTADVQVAVNSALQADKKKRRKKKLIIIAVILVVIIAIGAAAGSGGSSKKLEKADGSQQTGAQSEEAFNSIEPGMAVTVDDLKITYVSCDTDFKDYNKYASIKKGNKVIRAEFDYENKSNSDISLDGFECYADNNKCESFYSADDDANPTLESVAPGRTFHAVVYYEVPETAEKIELECDAHAWSNEKLTFIIK